MEMNYFFRGVNLEKVRNKNEGRVIDLLETVLNEIDGFDDDYTDIEDIYALSLNLLPARYVQLMGTTEHEPVTDGEIEAAVRQAVERVLKSPNH